jgi:hypothetical protein
LRCFNRDSKQLAASTLERAAAAIKGVGVRFVSFDFMSKLRDSKKFITSECPPADAKPNADTPNFLKLCNR